MSTTAIAPETPISITANKLLINNQWTEAASAYREALRLQPCSDKPWPADAWNCLGLAYLQGGKNADAILAFGKSISLKPHYPAAWHNLGLAYFRQGRTGEAVRAYLIAMCHDHYSTLKPFWEGPIPAWPEDIERLLSRLSTLEREVIELRLGYNAERPLSTEEVADHLNRPLPEIQSVEKVAQRKLQFMVRSVCENGEGFSVV